MARGEPHHPGNKGIISVCAYIAQHLQKAQTLTAQQHRCTGFNSLMKWKVEHFLQFAKEKTGYCKCEISHRAQGGMLRARWLSM